MAAALASCPLFSPITVSKVIPIIEEKEIGIPWIEHLTTRQL
jgi:hypothetical protein